MNIHVFGYLLTVSPISTAVLHASGHIVIINYYHYAFVHIMQQQPFKSETTVIPGILNFAGDVAAFTSRSMIEGLGLSTAELMLARGSAVKYAGKRDKPARLVELMVRFGLNFLTLEPLTTEHLQALRTTSTNHWSQELRSLPQPPDDESESSSEEESQLTVSWDTRDEIRTLPGSGPDTEEHNTAVRRHFDSLVQRFVTRTIVTEAVAVRTETARRRPSGTSGYHRRKQATPRRAISTTSGDTSNPPVSGQEAEGVTPPPPVAEPTRNPRTVLLALADVKATTIPSEVSLNWLEHFLRDNQPCDPQRVSCNENNINSNDNDNYLI